MGVGEVVTLSDAAQVRSFRIAGGGESRDYRMIVHSASESPGATTAMQVVLTADGASGNAVPTQPLRARPPSRLSDRELRLRASSYEQERILKRRADEELRRVGARAYRPGLDVSASVVSGSPPQLGEVLTFKVGIALPLSGDCNSNITVTGEVKYAGQHFTIVEDQQVAGHFTNADFQEIGQQLDDVVYPTNVAYFGAPADIDNNETVIALITAEVNKLTPAGSNAIIAGFFLAGDLADVSSCPASNQGEIFYLAGPDPNSTFGAEISLDFANTLARTTVAHEFLHLINTQQRVTIGGGSLVSDREDAWLDEALAHLAEELAGLVDAGFGTRANLGLAQITATDPQLDAFNDFHLLNFDRFGTFLYDGPEETLALGDASGFDPGGEASLPFRGFAYGFVRWLGDHFGPSGAGVLPGSREELLFRELSSGGPTFLKGIANVERAVQVVGSSNLQWEELLSYYLASLVVDDDAPSGVDPMTQFASWDMRDVFGALNGSNLGNSEPFNRLYPLLPSSVTLSSSTNQTISFTTNASTGRFISLTSPGTSPDLDVGITNQSGADLSAGARGRVTIIRTR
ncbi:MAG: hypothetical protein MJB57_13460 [Gemmatimonadetes bacterium]|nr:hypothetical protein [Gemmatimonadota bacterium]